MRAADDHRFNPAPFKPRSIKLAEATRAGQSEHCELQCSETHAMVAGSTHGTAPSRKAHRHLGCKLTCHTLVANLPPRAASREPHTTIWVKKKLSLGVEKLSLGVEWVVACVWTRTLLEGSVEAINH